MAAATPPASTDIAAMVITIIATVITVVRSRCWLINRNDNKATHERAMLSK